MNITKKGQEIIIRHKLMKNETYKVSEGSKFKSFSVYQKPQEVSGFSNMCACGKGIILLDYDNVDKSVVEEDYKSIQSLYNLPMAYVISTRENNFHVICLKKFLSSKIYEILLHTRADTNYKDMPLRTPFRSWVLRISGKKGSGQPKFVGMIGKNVNLKYECSRAHLRLLSKLYKLPPIDYLNLDDFAKVRMQIYQT